MLSNNVLHSVYHTADDQGMHRSISCVNLKLTRWPGRLTGDPVLYDFKTTTVLFYSVKLGSKLDRCHSQWFQRNPRSCAVPRVISVFCKLSLSKRAWFILFCAPFVFALSASNRPILLEFSKNKMEIFCGLAVDTGSTLPVRNAQN